MTNEQMNRDKAEMIEIIDTLSKEEMTLLRGFMLGLLANDSTT